MDPRVAYTSVAKMSFPATVSAIAINETGSFDVIEKLEVPFPQQKPNEIVLKVCFYARLV